MLIGDFNAAWGHPEYRRLAAAGPLPDDPIAVGPKTELDDDDRLYVGAWSRVVVRRATPDEVDAYA